MGSSSKIAPAPDAVASDDGAAKSQTVTNANETAALREEVARLSVIVKCQGEELRELRQLSLQEFTVAQYNILAGYLGDNTQPWFLYGLELTEERRGAIMKKFYERDVNGKLVNIGWPNYVTGLLTDEEIAAVQELNAKHFAWDVRKPRLVEVIVGLGADLISLVECDHYEDCFLPAMEARGYGAVYKKRPRSSSDDGCAIFYRRSVFELVASQPMEFVDKFDPATGRKVKDRIALLALMRHSSGRRLIFISTHLARNPEDPAQTKSRAKQTAQLMKGVTDFAKVHQAMHDPVLLAGDLNTTNIREIANIARTVFELCTEECHPVIFSAVAPRTLHTSVTTTRKMTIDYLFCQNTLEIIDRSPMPYLDKPIPDSNHPSDHVPISFRVRWSRACSPALATTAAPPQCALSAPSAPPLRPRLRACRPLAHPTPHMAQLQMPRDRPTHARAPVARSRADMGSISWPLHRRAAVPPSQIGFKRLTTQVHSCARAWAVVILVGGGDDAHDAHATQPLQPRELATAFSYWDLDGSGSICSVDLQEGLADLGLAGRHQALIRALEETLGRTLANEETFSVDEFTSAYLHCFRKFKSHFQRQVRAQAACRGGGMRMRVLIGLRSGHGRHCGDVGCPPLGHARSSP